MLFTVLFENFSSYKKGGGTCLLIKSFTPLSSSTVKYIHSSVNARFISMKFIILFALIASIISIVNCSSLIQLQCNTEYVQTSTCIQILSKFHDQFAPGSTPGSALYRQKCESYTSAISQAFIEAKQMPCLFRCKFVGKCIDNYI